MVITSLFSSFYCNFPSQDEVRMFIKTLGLLLVLLSSYNKLAALGLVLALVAVSYPRDKGQNRKKTVFIIYIKKGKDKNVLFRSISPSKKLLSWLLMS